MQVLWFVVSMKTRQLTGPVLFRPVRIPHAHVLDTTTQFEERSSCTGGNTHYVSLKPRCARGGTAGSCAPIGRTIRRDFEGEITIISEATRPSTSVV